MWNDDKRSDWRKAKIDTFIYKHGFTPDLISPKRFSEKLLKRCLFDEDPYYRMYGSKLFAPFFLRTREIPGLKLPKRLKVVRELKPVDFDGLPSSFVVKSSFGSGLNEIVRDKSKLEVPALCTRLNDQRDSIVNAQGRSDPENCFIFEQLVSPSSSAPDDYKFHCFNNANGAFTFLLQIDTDRYGDHRQTVFNQKFEVVELRFARRPRHEQIPQQPQNLSDLARIAKQISKGFDYVRVDLYNTTDGIYFGEITPFHQGAKGVVTPEKWDYLLGDLWHQRLPSFDPLRGLDQTK